MLASIFSKTKPINYIILTLLVVICYSLFQLSNGESVDIIFYEVAKRLLFLLLFLLMMVLSQFIVAKNRLVNDNAYVPLLFVSFILFFPSTFTEGRIIISAYFIMLALRRIFSLHSNTHSKEKIFDASLWILVASLFHFWSILYLILLFFAIIFFVAKDYKNWIIPLLAFFTVFIGLTIYLLVNDMTYLEWLTKKLQVSLNFMYFENTYQNIALAVFSSIAVLFFLSEAIDIKNKAYNMQSTYKKMILCFLIGVAIFVVSPEKSNGVLLFTFFPLAVLGTKHIEGIKQKWRKEIILTSIFLLGLFFYGAQLFL
ncbi:DUF6427 family protein [Myroides pelagicus]|uniref:DUF6427 family protein n=1 Tax=Myroides pelagicus TaxID=270914 RepID=UPI002DBE18A1|nr:DUF6427 family protein [Myroides pelagicus]MEC4113253.1 DUF6427 family protein [Myroides pelagicus]